MNLPSAPHLLWLDASARPGRAGIEPHGSHSRALSDRFVSRWRARSPNTRVTVRDVGLSPPRPVDADWIRAAFSRDAAHDAGVRATLAESDALIAEVRAADVLVIGMPMYNFGLPAGLKAWVDNIVRIGVTFGFDPARPDPYTPLLAERPRRAVILTARGGSGFDAGGALAQMNFADPHLRVALAFIGITEVDTIAIESEETGGDALAASVAGAFAQVDRLVDTLAPRRAAA